MESGKGEEVAGIYIQRVPLSHDVDAYIFSAGRVFT